MILLYRIQIRNQLQIPTKDRLQIPMKDHLQILTKDHLQIPTKGHLQILPMNQLQMRMKSPTIDISKMFKSLEMECKKYEKSKEYVYKSVIHDDVPYIVVLKRIPKVTRHYGIKNS